MALLYAMWTYTMPGQYEIGDRAKVSESRRLERLEVMAAVRSQRSMEVWTESCPTCFVQLGERCVTRNFK